MFTTLKVTVKDTGVWAELSDQNCESNHSITKEDFAAIAGLAENSGRRLGRPTGIVDSAVQMLTLENTYNSDIKPLSFHLADDSYGASVNVLEDGAQVSAQLYLLLKKLMAGRQCPIAD